MDAVWEFFEKGEDTTLPGQSLSINKLKDIFFSLKTNKSSDVDKINLM